MRIASKSARSEVLLSVKLGLIFFVTQGRPEGRPLRTNSCDLWARRGGPSGPPHLYLFQHRLSVIDGQRLHRLLLRRDQLDIETERLQLANEHVERFGQSRRERSVALDDRLVNLGASRDVVRFRREQLL